MFPCFKVLNIKKCTNYRLLECMLSMVMNHHLWQSSSFHHCAEGHILSFNRRNKDQQTNPKMPFARRHTSDVLTMSRAMICLLELLSQCEILLITSDNLNQNWTTISLFQVHINIYNATDKVSICLSVYAQCLHCNVVRFTKTQWWFRQYRCKYNSLVVDLHHKLIKHTISFE